MSYQEDRKFTEYVHKNIALEKIYKPLGWEEVELDKEQAEELDINKGIDRTFKTPKDKYVTVQERFRIKKYKDCDDFTIRYTRKKNTKEDRKKSEFFKIEADYFVYGITNCENKKNQNCKDFIKFAVVDYNIVKTMIDDGVIVIDENCKEHSSKIKEGKIAVPILYNKDGSSEFIPIKISDLEKLSEQIQKYKGVIVLKKGF